MEEKQKSSEKNNLDKELDWEYSSDFFTPNPELSGNQLKTLEEYAAEGISEMEEPEKKADIELEKIIEDVRKVKEESMKGYTVKEIGEKLNLTEQYITTILFTVQGYPEDNDYAVAQLVKLG